MAKIATQTINGKAFEYALLDELFSQLKTVTSVLIVDSSPYKTAKKCFHLIDEKEQGEYRLAAKLAVNFLTDIEPRLKNGFSDWDTLQLEIVSDKAGQSGDVRDVLAIRSLQKWEIGISAKNNHRAIKHSRLSNDIDFGKKWLNLPCSISYFNEIKPIFDNLAKIKKESNSTQKWDTLGDYHKLVYVPILNAFKRELERLDKENPKVVAGNLVKYLIGNQDFYKVIKTKNKVEFQGYNLHGTLNLPFEKINPTNKFPKLKLPNTLFKIVYKEESDTTLSVIMDEGWQIDFRIHNASSRIEPSLKFDINLISSPYSLQSLVLHEKK